MCDCSTSDAIVCAHFAHYGGKFPTYQDTYTPGDPEDPKYAWYEIVNSEYVSTSIELSVRPLP